MKPQHRLQLQHQHLEHSMQREQPKMKKRMKTKRKQHCSKLPPADLQRLEQQQQVERLKQLLVVKQQEQEQPQREQLAEQNCLNSNLN